MKRPDALTGVVLALLAAGLACTCMPLSTVDLLGEGSEAPREPTILAQLTNLVPTMQAEATSFFGQATQHAPDVDATMTAVIATVDSLSDSAEAQATFEVQLTAMVATVDAALDNDGFNAPLPGIVDGLDTTGGGTLTVNGEAQSATLDSLFEVHNWTFNGEAGQTITIEVTGEGETDPQIRLLGPGDALLAEDDDSGGGLNARLATTLPETGAYTARVSVFTEGTYTIRITSP